MDDKELSKKTGRKVLMYLVLFFIIFASVDALFIYMAVSTHSGVVAENAYEIGVKYNDVIAEAKKKANDASLKPE